MAAAAPYYPREHGARHEISLRVIPLHPWGCRLPKVFLLGLVGALALAQVIPSCGGEDQPIVGWVVHKFLSPFRNAYIIEIDNVEYDVPQEFYDEVKVGDLVKRENGVWRIVKRGGG